jgi:hypothetical protein
MCSNHKYNYTSFVTYVNWIHCLFFQSIVTSYETRRKIELRSVASCSYTIILFRSPVYKFRMILDEVLTVLYILNLNLLLLNMPLIVTVRQNVFSGVKMGYIYSRICSDKFSRVIFSDMRLNKIFKL